MTETVVRLAITGMHCASCGMLIDETLEDLPGVSRSSTSMRKEVCEVRFDDAVTSLDVITEELGSLGYGANLRR